MVQEQLRDSGFQFGKKLRRHLKIFLLAAILLGGVEPFEQFWYMALYGTFECNYFELEPEFRKYSLKMILLFLALVAILFS